MRLEIHIYDLSEERCKISIVQGMRVREKEYNTKDPMLSEFISDAWQMVKGGNNGI